MDKKLLEAQAGLLAFRKPEETIESRSDYKLLYKRAALINHQKVEGSGDANMMKVINSWKERIELYFSERDSLKMPEGVNIDTCKLPSSIDPLRFADVPSFKSLDTLISEAFEIVRIERLFDLANRYKNEYFDRERQLCIAYSQGYMGYVYMQDLTNAFESRLSCVSFRIEVSDVLDKTLKGRDYQDARTSLVLHRFFDEVVGTDDISSIWSWLNELADFDKYGRSSFEFGASKITVTKRLDKGSKVFSPFKLDKLKPVVNLPPKPTKSHMIKLLVNGQFSQLKDSYYYDPEYGSGYLETHGVDSGYGLNPFYYARQLLSGRASADYGSELDVATIRITCNEWKNVNIRLENRFLTEDIQRDNIAGLI